MNWPRRLGDEAGAELQQYLGAGQLGHEVAVLQGEIRVDEVAIIEADLALQIRQQGQPRRSASSATALPCTGSWMRPATMTPRLPFSSSQSGWAGQPGSPASQGLQGLAECSQSPRGAR